MKYYNVTFKWYDTDTYCANIAKAESAEDVKAHYAKYDSNPTITEASAYDVTSAQERGKPIVTCPHIENDPTEAAEETTTDSTDTESQSATESATPYTITHNADFDSTEVEFDGKPSEEVRAALKALRFRWHGQRRVWYGYRDPDTVRAAIEGATQGATATPAEGRPRRGEGATRPAQVDREALRAQFCKAWDDPRMIDFCVNKVAAVAVLPSGEIITVDKQSIEKDFCFGESGYDYDEAQKSAAHARKSETYFKARNMEHFDRWIADLMEARNMSGHYALVIGSKQYIGQTDDCKLAFVEFVRLSDVIDACGGSCYLEELPGKMLTIRGSYRRVATPEEIDLITDAYKQARAAHEKKVDAYLKRYGTSKVHAWTYWLDA